MTYEIRFIGNGSGVSSSNGPVFETSRKKEAIALAKRSAVKHGGHRDFAGGWYEVWANGVCVFQSRTVSHRQP